MRQCACKCDISFSAACGGIAMWSEACPVSMHAGCLPLHAHPPQGHPSRSTQQHHPRSSWVHPQIQTVLLCASSRKPYPHEKLQQSMADSGTCSSSSRSWLIVVLAANDG